MRWRGPSGGLGPRIIGLALGCTLLPVVAAIGLLVGLAAVLFSAVVA